VPPIVREYPKTITRLVGGCNAAENSGSDDALIPKPIRNGHYWSTSTPLAYYISFETSIFTGSFLLRLQLTTKNNEMNLPEHFKVARAVTTTRRGIGRTLLSIIS
jgi:hypothetical protein